MFTVVITEQAHIDGLEEYQTFLQPFLDRSDVVFCRWHMDAETLTDAVPELINTVSRHERWRLIVVADEAGLEQKNPFDLVPYRKPVWPAGLDQSEYLNRVRQTKFAAFDLAAKQPLTRLMTWLCQSPTVTSGRNQAERDPEFAEYMAEFRKKEELRAGIRSGETLEIVLPTEIICVARRCYEQTEYDIQTAWNHHEDCQYSRFYDWNMYFDKMRYLIFDTLPKHHRSYTYDYIRFLYSLVLLARNPIPQSSLNPNRVYTLCSDTDEKALRQLLGKFDGKLAATEAFLEQERNEILSRERPRLSDKDAQMIFCSPTSIPVTVTAEFDQSPMFVPGKNIGLSTDCPDNEEGYWDNGYRQSRRTLTKYLKLPRRALKKATVELRRMNTADLDYASRLNEFQLEDVQDHVAEEELQMVATRTVSFYETERYDRDLNDQNKHIREIIDRRLTRKRTLVLGFSALLGFAVGFLPLLFGNLRTDEGVQLSLSFAWAGIGLMALITLVTLLFLRRPLRKGISGYNGIMKGILDELDNGQVQYSKYLSHACNVMRGNSVLNYRAEHESPEVLKLRVYKKHSLDVLRKREELREIFGSLMPVQTPVMDPKEGYQYDFTRPVDYPYPIPYQADQYRKVEFLQRGNMVEVPVNFVQRMHIRREELYD